MTYLRLGDLVDQPDVAYLRHVCDCHRNTVPPVPELPSVTSLGWDEMTRDEEKIETAIACLLPEHCATYASVVERYFVQMRCDEWKRGQ